MNSTKAYVPNSQQVVVKSNRLIETGYKLGKREQYFVLYLISRLDSMRQTDFRHYEMSFVEIKRILNYDGVKRLANRDAVFEIMNNLNRTPIYWEKSDENGELEERGQMTWISSLKHNVKTDTFTFNFDANLKPFLLQLEEYFTKYALHNIKNFSKSHSIRMYEILKVYERQRRVEISLERLKFYLGITDKYEKFYELKRWVLDPTKDELRVFTDIRFEYRVAKKYRKTVLSVEFLIYPNNPNQQEIAEGEETDIEELYRMVNKWGITRRTIKKYLAKYPKDYIIQRIDYVKKQLAIKKARGESIENIGGYLHSIIDQLELFAHQESKEQKRAAQRKALEEAQQQKKLLETQLKKLRAELFREETNTIEQLFKSNPRLKKATIKAVKMNKHRYFNEEWSDVENYEKSKPFRAAVHNEIIKSYPNEFEPIRKKYHAQIDRLKNSLAQL